MKEYPYIVIRGSYAYPSKTGKDCSISSSDIVLTWSEYFEFLNKKSN